MEITKLPKRNHLSLIPPPPKNIRPARTSDAKRILEIYSPYILETAITFETKLPSVQEIETRIHSGKNRFPWLVYEKDDSLLGYAYAGPHRTREAYRWCCESSIYLERSSLNQGIGKKLYQELFSQLKSRGFINVYAGCTLPNEGSVRFHEFFDFEKIGIYPKTGFKFGKWHDVIWWHKVLQNHPTEPQKICTHQ